MRTSGEAGADMGGAPPSQARERPYRVAWINTHPIQYFAPLYAYLTRHGIEVTALYLSDFSLRGGHDRGFGQAVRWDIDLLAGYKVEFMGQRASRRQIDGFFSAVAPELWAAITRGRFDAVVIHGHNLAAHHVALAAARASGTPVFARGETHLRLQRPSWKQAIRTPLLKCWYKAFDGFLAIGAANRHYYEAMGVAPEKIFPLPYTVDNDRFMQAADASSTPESRARIRQRLGLSSDAPAILYAAKFDVRKRPDDLVAAFGQLQAKGIDAQLVMVGSGLLEGKLGEMVTRQGLKNVVFPGFVNQTDLPGVYAACDLFVLPSDNEPWGLAVNEAMCAGLPIVLSEEIGCAQDLVQPGVNGATFEAGDIPGLAAALEPLLTDVAYRHRAGAASRARISQWSYAQCADGLREALAAVRMPRLKGA